MCKVTIDHIVKNIDSGNEWNVAGNVTVKTLSRVVMSFWDGETLDVSIYCHLQDLRNMIDDDFLTSKVVDFSYLENKKMEICILNNPIIVCSNMYRNLVLIVNNQNNEAASISIV